jgi:hypothetical protein
MADMNLYVVVIITILIGIGLTFLFVGALFTIVSAFGNKRKFWGIISVLIPPLILAYVILYWQETAYPRKYLLSGSALVIIAAACFSLL